MNNYKLLYSFTQSGDNEIVTLSLYDGELLLFEQKDSYELLSNDYPDTVKRLLTVSKLMSRMSKDIDSIVLWTDWVKKTNERKELNATNRSR